MFEALPSLSQLSIKFEIPEIHLRNGPNWDRGRLFALAGYFTRKMFAQLQVLRLVFWTPIQFHLYVPDEIFASAVRLRELSVHRKTRFYYKRYPPAQFFK